MWCYSVMEGQKTNSLQKRLTADGLLVPASVLPAPSWVSQPAPPLLLTLMLSLHLCVEQCSSRFPLFYTVYQRESLHSPTTY